MKATEHNLWIEIDVLTKKFIGWVKISMKIIRSEKIPYF